MKNCMLLLGLAVSAAVACAAAPPQARVPITQAQIAAAISDAGMQVTADQVSFLADVEALAAAPSLVVESMQSWGDHRMRVRMSCANSEQCMPFFVAIRLNGVSAPQQPIAAADSSLIANARAASDPKNFVVHAGSAATLLLDGGHVHIRLAVVCLENGAAGQTIRVASKDHRQTYMAKVVDQTVLRASL
jgi:Chaperone for flagella basal body P-ring formation